MKWLFPTDQHAPIAHGPSSGRAFQKRNAIINGPSRRSTVHWSKAGNPPPKPAKVAKTKEPECGGRMNICAEGAA